MARRKIRPPLWIAWLWFLGVLVICALLNAILASVGEGSLLASFRFRRALTLGLVEFSLLPWVMREHARRSLQRYPLVAWFGGWFLSWMMLVLMAEVLD